MTCQQIAQFLLDYLSDELPADERTTFEAHVRICPDCENYIDSYRKTIALSKLSERAPEIEQQEIPESLVQAILTSKNRAN